MSTMTEVEGTSTTTAPAKKEKAPVTNGNGGAKAAKVEVAEAAKAPTMRELFEAQRHAHRLAPNPSYEQRVDRLDRLEKVLLGHKDAIAEAIRKDFGNRSRHESLLAEVYVTRGAIEHTRGHLREWMRVDQRDVQLTLLPARAEVWMQPLGVIGIIAPWNYPLQLALAPLAQVLAAGNRAMIKPSELVPETSELIVKMMRAAFDPTEVAVSVGGPEVGKEFASLPFDHLVFTGSTRVGRMVMREAAENLTPVTLELGGKSPAIVLDDFDIDDAAQRIMTGKCFNAGQTCIAPDYALVPRAKMDRFVEACRAAVAKLYPDLPASADYTSIITAGHRDRLLGLVDDARERGAKVLELCARPEKDEGGAEKGGMGARMPPTLVVDPKEEMSVMQEEIFGPVLPIRPYETIEEALDYVNDHPRPLALYVFGHDDGAVDRVIENTMSGGVTVNDTMLHFAADDLPFGGVGPSGIGHYHGREGFESFSKKRPIFFQSRLSASKVMRPPYGKLLDLFLRATLGR